MAKKSVKKLPAAPPEVPAPIEPEVLPEKYNIESMLPTADFTAEDLKTWRDKKAEVMDALQLRTIMDLQNDPQLRRQILQRQGYNALETLDRIGRLERGQSTSNISIAVFDAQVEAQKKKVAELEALREKLRREEEDAQKSGAQAQEGSSGETRVG